jgi:hypothetical protein
MIKMLPSNSNSTNYKTSIEKLPPIVLLPLAMQPDHLLAVRELLTLRVFA